MSRGYGLLGTLVAATAAGVATGVVSRRLSAALPSGRERWERKNFRGATVTLAAGPAAVVGAATGIALAPDVPRGARAAGVAGALAVGAVGLYDDFAPFIVGQKLPGGRNLPGGTTPAGDAAAQQQPGRNATSKGLRGHLAALREGEVTSGVVKIGVIGLSGLAGAAMVSDDPLDAVIGGAAVAGHANLLNLLDLRPGRANKAALLHAPLVLHGPGRALGAAALGASLASLPDDLGERTMLGDCGANALGALLGLAMVAHEGRPARLAHLAVVAGLTLASEKVSFTRVIENTPLLRELDGLGRRP